MGNRRMLKEMKKGNLSGKQENAQGDEERKLEWETGERSRR